MTKNTLKKDYFWNSLGALLQSALSPLLLIVVTRLNGIDDSGLFSFALAISIIFWAIGMWGGRTFQVSDVKKEFTNQSYIMVRIMLAVLMIVGALLFSTLNSYDTTKTIIILSLVMLRALDSIADSLYGVMQVGGRLYIAGKSLTYKFFTGGIVFVIVDILTNNLILACISMVAISALIVFIYDIPKSKKIGDIGFANQKITETVLQAASIMMRTWPIFIVAFLSAFSLNIPRYFLDLYHPDEIGYFGIIAMPITLIVLFVTFILQPNIVAISKLFAKKDYKRFDKFVSKLTLVCGLICAGVIVIIALCGVPVLNLIFGVSFENYYVSLLVIAAGAAANAYVAIYTNIFIIMRHFKAIFYILLLTNIALIPFSIYFVREYSLLGAVSLFTIVNMIQAIGLTIAYKVLLKKVGLHEKN